ncbi:PUA-like domain-containing protein [Xylariales sp. PMI_506]|nr:PUA-like domain-containing protein [Xylariales sp. PMI_506]
MPKRKTEQLDPAAEPLELRRSTRRKSSAPQQSAPKRAAEEAAVVEKPATKVRKTVKAEGESEVGTAKTKAKKGSSKVPEKSAAGPKAKATAANDTTTLVINGTSNSNKTYWLLKAEPETRFENGTDVKFSIDDLAARTEPEPWDGIRNYVARNNLRAMKKGDLAFFYHSNCKEPAIVGTMEIVREHSPDLSAHDPKAPYYDASSKPSDPKWSVVHVEFRSKFVQPIGLKELREMGKMGSPLENMQMLKQSRLSVSRVSPVEWEYLMGVVEERGGVSKQV